MANIVFNKLTVIGKKPNIVIKNCISKKKGKKIFDFEKIAPLGSHNWETYWGCSDCVQTTQIGKDFIIFESRWNPPFGLINKLAHKNQFYTFKLDYGSYDWGYTGAYVAQWTPDGVIVKQHRDELKDEVCLEKEMLFEDYEYRMDYQNALSELNEVMPGLGDTNE